MPRYFFDAHDGVTFIQDDTGVDCDSIEAARHEATRGLADLARDVIPGATRKELVIEVRGEAGHRLLEAWLSFEVRPAQ